MAVLRFSSEIRAQTSSFSRLSSLLCQGRSEVRLCCHYLTWRQEQGKVLWLLQTAALNLLRCAWGKVLLQVHNGAWQSNGPAWLGRSGCSGKDNYT